MECPRCQASLEEKGGAHDRHMCPNGHGRFLESAESQTLIGDKMQLSPEFLRDLATQFGGRTQLTCMQCKQSMKVLQLKGAWVDMCFGCSGMWLDTGELSLLDPTVELEESLTDLYSPEHAEAALPVIKGEVMPAIDAPWHDSEGRPGYRYRTWHYGIPLSMALMGVLAFFAKMDPTPKPVGAWVMIGAVGLATNIWGSLQTTTIMDPIARTFVVKHRALYKWKTLQWELDQIDHISMLRYIVRTKNGKRTMYRMEATTKWNDQIPLVLHKSSRPITTRKLADRLNRLLKKVQSGEGAAEAENS